MPTAALRPCTYPGCGLLTKTGRCDRHQRAEQREHDQGRGGSTERGYGYRWQKASKAYLRAHPLCQCPDCQEGKLRIVVANVVDHRIPHRGDMNLFWDSTNWQSMAKECHDRKTPTENGGFGNIA
jgi:5-methylcytosine-specific restriction protein A